MIGMALGPFGKPGQARSPTTFRRVRRGIRSLREKPGLGGPGTGRLFPGGRALTVATIPTRLARQQIGPCAGSQSLPHPRHRRHTPQGLRRRRRLPGGTRTLRCPQTRPVRHVTALDRLRATRSVHPLMVAEHTRTATPTSCCTTRSASAYLKSRAASPPAATLKDDRPFSQTLPGASRMGFGSSLRRYGPPKRPAANVAERPHA